MKIFFTILTLIVFSLNQVVYYLGYTIVGHMEKEKMEAHLLGTIPESECEVINLSPETANFYWEKPNEIFFLNGVMYDVAKTKVIDGKTYLYCITENKESEMLDDITLQYSSDDYNGKQLKLAFSEEYVLHEIEVLNLFANSLTRYGKISSSTLQQFKDILIPPPRLLALSV